MDVVVIFHGLGNQMSQYAFYLQKRRNNKSTYYISFGNSHNGIELEKIFNINWKQAFFQKILYILFRILLTQKPIIRPLKLLVGLFNIKIVEEGYDYSFKKEYLLPSKGLTFYLGGWHSEKYFSSIDTTIKSTFKFNDPKDAENSNVAAEIGTNNSVSIHVRRGDYLNPANINLFGDICNKAYFDKAISLITGKVTAPHFYVFSNDFNWVKHNLVMDNVTYVTFNSGEDSWKDMYLMSLCKHNIIANSTFSWWSAWLNKNPDKIVIAPDRFIKVGSSTDIYPDSWIKLSDY